MEEKLDSILQKFSSLETRLTKIEEKQASQAQASPPEDQGEARFNFAEESTNAASPQVHSDIGRQFDAIREKYSKTQLPSNYKLNDTPAGIKQDQKPCLKIISRSARHAETGLKIIAGITAPENEFADGSFHLTSSQAQELYTIFASQATFLQSEYTSLVVKSTFSAETSRIFRSFENNSSAFNESSLRNVRIAAELSAIAERNQGNPRGAQSQSYRGQRAARPFRAHGRGFGFSQRGNWNRDFPQRPPMNEEGNQNM